ncbi:MAG: hypothetical protein PHC75_03380 [Burkholderiales bacterium]|nr:hypothetical protein [Burkholderiales bacterium]
MKNDLSDDSFLQKVVELFNLVYMNDAVLLIDAKGIILHAGDKIKEIVNLDAKTLISKNHLEVLPIPVENIPNIMKSIDYVFESKKSYEFLSINLNHNIDHIVLHCVQKPIINPFTHNVVAFSVESKKLPFHIYLNNFSLYLNEQLLNKHSIDKTHKDSLFTLREHEISFLSFYFKTAKKIALVLSRIYDKQISDKTISNIISSQIYAKLGVYGQEAMLEKLHSLGYQQKIPSSFLSNMYIELT